MLGGADGGFGGFGGDDVIDDAVLRTTLDRAHDLGHEAERLVLEAVPAARRVRWIPDRT